LFSFSWQLSVSAGDISLVVLWW